MATTEFWVKMAFILVFGGGCFACYRAATKAEQDGNKRKATILGIASLAILILGSLSKATSTFSQTMTTTTMATN